MSWIDQILAEAGKTFLLALKITGYLFWWAFVGLAAGARRIGFHLQGVSLRGSGYAATGQPIEAKQCPVCGAENEAGAHRCYACGNRL